MSVDAQGQLVAGRYRIESEIARGGVGTVYQVRDESTGQRVALKRLLRTTADNARVRMLFQREYHTLTEIKHPRIIEVLEYGLDEEQPYYTMELLDGKDLSELAPMPYVEACRFLRDVASSIALLHSRHLLHRDLSPRNVRHTSDGRCKLLDFGTMASFGVSQEIVGTPPLVAPEALRGMPLDHRADLYSLGALAYYMLTRRYAYRARRLEDLPQLWQTEPVPPSTLVPEVPPELDRLVMSLMSMDPVLRPNSATEVIDRLTSIAELEPDPDAVATAQGYLLRSRMVGRRRHIERIKRRLTRTHTGHGSSVLIEGNPGVGKTRLLDEASLHAQLTGTLPLRIEARANPGPYGVARALVRALLHAAPQQAREAAAPYQAVLQAYFPELSDAPGEPPRLEGHDRVALQRALLEWLLAVSDERPLILLVDDLQRVDEPSAALLASLAHGCRRHPIMLVLTRRLAGTVAAPRAMATISGLSRRIRVHRLRRRDTQELVAALFGDVQNVAALGQWIHDVSTGTPMQTMALSQHLVDVGLVRYVDGMWVLPTEVSTEELPLSMAAAMSARAAALGGDARHLAEALSVHRGGVPLQRAVAVADDARPQEVFRLLDELVARGVLVGGADGYHFSQEALRETLLAELDPNRLRELHLRHGEALLQSAAGRLEDLIDAGFHILRSGDETRGADLLAQSAPKLAARGDATSAAVPALEAALEVYERQGRSPETLLTLRVPILSSMERRAAQRHGDVTLRMLERHSGAGLARLLQPVVGSRYGALGAMVATGVVRSLSPASRRGPGPVRALSDFIQAVYTMLPVRSSVLDREALVELARYTGAMQDVSPATKATHLLVAGANASMSGSLAGAREALEQAEQIYDALPRMPGVHPAARIAMYAGVLIARAVTEAQHAMHSRTALATIEKLEALVGQATIGPGGGMTSAELQGAASQLRMLHHMLRGERELAERYREQHRLHGIQAGLQWQYDVWRTLADATSSAWAQDITGLRRAAEQLTQFVEEAPSLEPYARLTRGQLSLTRGQAEEAITTLEPLLALPAHSWQSWAHARAALAEALLLDGRPERALALLDDTVADLRANDPENLNGVPCALLRAQALANLHRHAEARDTLDEVATELTRSDNPMLLGNLHEMAARIAWQRGDPAGFRTHLEQVRHFYGLTRNPALLGRAQRTAELARSGEARVVPADSVPDPVTRVSTQRTAQGIDQLLADCEGPQERARRALHVLLDRSAGTSGHLYLWRREKLTLVASIEASEPQDELESGLQKQIRDYPARLASASNPATASAGVIEVGKQGAEPRERFATLILASDRDGGTRVVAAAALSLGSEPLRPLSANQLAAVARNLLADALG
jgi:tetratricopeptide (TPR) repeat protein/tRNA A-37 threonylcarbamoyl transferase component Bud32